MDDHHAEPTPHLLCFHVCKPCAAATQGTNVGVPLMPEFCDEGCVGRAIRYSVRIIVFFNFTERSGYPNERKATDYDGADTRH